MYVLQKKTKSKNTQECVELQLQPSAATIHGKMTFFPLSLYKVTKCTRKNFLAYCRPLFLSRCWETVSIALLFTLRYFGSFEWKLVKKSSYKFHVCLRVGLNETPKPLCALSWHLKLRIFNKIYRTIKSSLKQNDNEGHITRRSKVTSKVSRQKLVLIGAKYVRTKVAEKS